MISEKHYTDNIVEPWFFLCSCVPQDKLNCDNIASFKLPQKCTDTAKFVVGKDNLEGVRLKNRLNPYITEMD